ncbi:MAG: transaldolase family protein [Planctomycetota bacterium]
MTSPLQQLSDAGTTLWLDSVDPDFIDAFQPLGVSGATSNPIIIAGLLETGRFDDDLAKFFEAHASDEDVAWAMTDKLVSDAQAKFHGDWERSAGDTGWVSFELDPLIEDVDNPQSTEERAARYVELGKQWAAGHENRMIKVPATPGGLAALEELSALGITLNVTLIFSARQYEAARDAVWRGRQRFGQLDRFKSVYSIFVSRVDVYTQKKVAGLTDGAQGLMGVVNAKRIGIANAGFWSDKELELQQEMIFASTGAKLDWQAEDYYIAHLAGSDILTNPPETTQAIHDSGKAYASVSRVLPDQDILSDLDAKVDVPAMEAFLMEEGLAKFAEPHKQLIATIRDKRAALTAAG